MTPNTDKVLYFWIINIWHTIYGRESPQWFFPLLFFWAARFIWQP